MDDKPVDNSTWRTFGWADVKRFAWDACREVASNQKYSDPWVFQDFLTFSKRKAYKSDNSETIDSFFNNNNIYRPFLEEVINELVFWKFFSKSNHTTEVEDSVYFPTGKISEFEKVFKYFQDGEIDKIETYRVPNE
jgi:hypothetical protein